jgi:hypothetical protein
MYAGTHRRQQPFLETRGHVQGLRVAVQGAAVLPLEMLDAPHIAERLHGLCPLQRASLIPHPGCHQLPSPSQIAPKRFQLRFQRHGLHQTADRCVDSCLNLAGPPSPSAAISFPALRPKAHFNMPSGTWTAPTKGLTCPVMLKRAVHFIESRPGGTFSQAL